MVFWAKLMFFATAVATAITAAGVWLIKRTLDETKIAAAHTEGMLRQAEKTTIAAQESVKEARKTTKFTEVTADVSREALLATDRAWIKIEAELSGPLIFESERISVEVRITYRNIGKSPATHVYPFAELHPDIFSAGIKAQELADKRGSFSFWSFKSMNPGRVLFPDDDGVSHEWEIELPTSIFTGCITEHAKAAAEDEEPYTVTTAFPAILAGVRYLLPGDKEVRYTYVPFGIRSTERGHEGWDGAECQVWESELVLEQELMTGQVS